MRRAASKRRDPIDCAGGAGLSPPAKLKRKRLKSGRNLREEKSTSEDTDKRAGLKEAFALINATLIRSNRCDGLGVTGRGYAPVFALCRALVAAGHDPGRRLQAYRGDVLALKVRSIGEGARLTVREDRAGPRFVPWEPFPRRVKPKMRQKTEGAPTAPDQDDERSVRPGAVTRTPPLQARSIGKDAKLTIKEDRAGARFVPWDPSPRRVKPKMRQKTEGAPAAPDQHDERSARPGAVMRTPPPPSTRPNGPGAVDDQE